MRWDGRFCVFVFVNKNVTSHRNSLSHSDDLILVTDALGNILFNPVFVGCPLVTFANYRNSIITRIVTCNTIAWHRFVQFSRVRLEPVCFQRIC